MFFSKDYSIVHICLKKYARPCISLSSFRKTFILEECSTNIGTSFFCLSNNCTLLAPLKRKVSECGKHDEVEFLIKIPMWNVDGRYSKTFKFWTPVYALKKSRSS